MEKIIPVLIESSRTVVISTTPYFLSSAFRIGFGHPSTIAIPVSSNVVEGVTAPTSTADAIVIALKTEPGSYDPKIEGLLKSFIFFTWLK